MQREDWDARYAWVEDVWDEANRFLVAEAAELEPGRALDLACGQGRNAIWLATRGWEVTGVDFSEVAVVKALARAERDALPATFVCADLLDYEPDAGAYDLVLLLYLHVPESTRRHVLAKAASAVIPGGTFILVGHDVANMADGVGGPSDAALLYTPEQIAGELPADLEIEKAERVLRDVDGEERDAIDALVRARRPLPS
jgi:SAM-dependent methyltransferase